VENFLKQRYDDLHTREDAFRDLSEIFS
jgi:hypothetical protein